MITNFEKWKERAAQVHMARLLYIATGQTKNITTALRLFRENEGRGAQSSPIVITRADNVAARAVWDIYVLPNCKKCGEELFLNAFSL